MTYPVKETFSEIDLWLNECTRYFAFRKELSKIINDYFSGELNE